MYYIQQLQNDDCGIACLKMLLSRVYKKKDYLFLKQDLNHSCYSYLELINIAKDHGMTLNGYRYTNKKSFKKDHEKNILARVKVEGVGYHMVLVKNVILNRVRLADPYLGNYSMDYEKFLSIWDGTILKIDELKKDESELTKPYYLGNKWKLLLMFIRLLGLISGILGIFYIDNDIHMMIPISLMFACFVFEIAYRIASLNAMKKIDKDLLKNSFKPDEKADLFIRSYSSFKQMEVMLYPTLIYSLAITLFIVVIFVLNDIKNFIPILLLTFITFLEIFLLDPILENKKRSLERKEELLRRGRTGAKFIEQLKLLNKKSYEFGNIFMVKKLTLGIFIISMVVLFMYFSQVNDLSFIVFYCFGYYYLHSNLTALLTFSSKKDFLTQQRCLLMNIINK